jgi:hypothetical protein
MKTIEICGCSEWFRLHTEAVPNGLDSDTENDAIASLVTDISRALDHLRYANYVATHGYHQWNGLDGVAGGYSRRPRIAGGVVRAVACKLTPEEVDEVEKTVSQCMSDFREGLDAALESCGYFAEPEDE